MILQTYFDAAGLWQQLVGSVGQWLVGSYTKSFSIFKKSVNEVYYTNALILLIKTMLCSKLHCQKGFKLKLFFYKIVPSFLALMDRGAILKLGPAP